MKRDAFVVLPGAVLLVCASLATASVTTGVAAESPRYRIQYGGAPVRIPEEAPAARRSLYFQGHMDRIARQLDLSPEQQSHWAAFVDEVWVVLMSQKAYPDSGAQEGLVGRLALRMWQAEIHLERLSLLKDAVMRMYGVLDERQVAILDRELLFLMDPSEKASVSR